MKVLKGIQQLGFYKKQKVVIDWNYLIREHGIRKELNDIQKSLGVLLRILSILYMLFFIVEQFLSGKFFIVELTTTDSLLEVVFWIAIFLFCYSLYLLRDRTEFLDTLEIKTLDHLRHKEEIGEIDGDIEISDYFDYDLVYLLDDLLKEDQRFLQKLFVGLSEFKRVKELIIRLGITEDMMPKIVGKIELDIQGSRDRVLNTLMFESFSLAYKYGFESVDERVVFLYISKNIIDKVLREFKVLPEEVEGLLLWVQNESKKSRYKKLWREKASLKPKNTVNRAYTSRIAKTLEAFKRDFTLEVIEGNFTMSIARGQDLEELIRLLHQGDKGAVLVVGEPGIGKTTMIKSLAVRMVVEEVPKQLADRRLVGFDFNTAYALAGSVDAFKKVVEEVLIEVSEAGNIVLVIDDFDQLVNIRDQAAAEIVNLLTKAIDQNNLRILATSSKTGYNSSIKPQRGLVSLFDILSLSEPSDEVALQILIDELPKIEKKYRTSISLDALKTAIKLSHNYSFERVLPEKAIDLVEEGASYVKEKGLKFLTEKEIEILVSKKVGVNVGAISEEEKEKLLHLEEEMHKRVVGQDRAINAVADALRRARAGLAGENRPVAGFLFFGPTGVGKTEVAKTLAATYYGKEDLMIRLDMSEYQEEDNLKRLIGYRQGDDFFGGRLTESVREKPYSLLLIDEIEKANPRVLDLFLQVLDEGRLTDGIGREIDFTNTIIVATSNIGSNTLSDLIEKGIKYDEVYKQVLPILRSKLRVEFLNRFDDVIMFKPLERSQIEKVAEIFLSKVGKRLYDKGIFFEYDKRLLSDLAKAGYNPVYGAREMRRVVQKQIDDRIAEMIISGELTEGKKLLIHNLDNFAVVDPE